jgi:hypothetical protein
LFQLEAKRIPDGLLTLVVAVAAGQVRWLGSWDWGKS